MDTLIRHTRAQEDKTRCTEIYARCIIPAPVKARLAQPPLHLPAGSPPPLFARDNRRKPVFSCSLCAEINSLTRLLGMCQLINYHKNYVSKK